MPTSIASAVSSLTFVVPAPYCAVNGKSKGLRTLTVDNTVRPSALKTDLAVYGKGTLSVTSLAVVVMPKLVDVLPVSMLVIYNSFSKNVSPFSVAAS